MQSLFFNFFFKKMRRVFARRGYFVANSFLYSYNKNLFLHINILFQSGRTAWFRVNCETEIKRTPTVSTSTVSQNFYLGSFLQRCFKLYQKQGLSFVLVNLNKGLRPRRLKRIYRSFREFLPSLFTRRFNLFLDFIKVTALLGQNKCSASAFLVVLGRIFYILPKVKHGRFLFFIKFLFNFLLNQKKSKIFGLRLDINGRLKGKTRASTSSVVVGSIPTQRFSAKTGCGRLHVYTLYGAFGLTFWVYFKNKVYQMAFVNRDGPSVIKRLAA